MPRKNERHLKDMSTSMTETSHAIKVRAIKMALSENVDVVYQDHHAKENVVLKHAMAKRLLPRAIKDCIFEVAVHQKMISMRMKEISALSKLINKK